MLCPPRLVVCESLGSRESITSTPTRGTSFPERWVNSGRIELFMARRRCAASGVCMGAVHCALRSSHRSFWQCHSWVCTATYCTSYGASANLMTANSEGMRRSFMNNTLVFHYQKRALSGCRRCQNDHVAALGEKIILHVCRYWEGVMLLGGYSLQVAHELWPSQWKSRNRRLGSPIHAPGHATFRRAPSLYYHILLWGSEVNHALS